jgi:hypothetical protein
MAIEQGHGQTADPVAPFRAVREQFIARYRETGQRGEQTLIEAENRVANLAGHCSGAALAQALVELGTMQRLREAFQTAIETLTEGAQLAVAAGRTDIAFAAYINIARAHAYGTKNYSAAATAFDCAAAAAGATATPKQRFDLANYRSHLEAGRGELDSAIVDSVEAVRAATSDDDRFYASLDLADALLKKAESCDYRPLSDARSHESGDDLYGACRRALAAADAQYTDARAIADRLGWRFLAQQVSSIQSQLQARAQLIELRARTHALMFPGPFAPNTVHDVLVNENFAPTASQQPDAATLATLVEQVLAETGKHREPADSSNSRALCLRALAKDARGDNPESVALLMQEAARLLAAERSALFDPRRRGTVIESRGEIILDLALRLLALGKQRDAFAAFESIRARGLGELGQF